ncbi:hypothetical protein F5884DRAFT_121184 [Xylogone sp. PMI_703]|nr:hypothetical protein F5884DRAFT_121184 [Xylogone sp. PMI_703]
MSEGLFAIFCTVEVEAAVINQWLSNAYEGVPVGSRSLYLMVDETPPTAGTPPTAPDVPPIPSFPFLSKGVQWLATFIRENAANSALSGTQFLVIDEKTSETDSLVFVRVDSAAGLATIRLGTSHINSIPVSINLGTVGLDELQDFAGDDGVFRG